MSTTPAARTTTAELVCEIHETMAEVGPRREHPDREYAAALDITLALLIRHRLRIDAGRTQRAVSRARCEDLEVFAYGCAEHITAIIGEQDAAEADTQS